MGRCGPGFNCRSDGVLNPPVSSRREFAAMDRQKFLHTLRRQGNCRYVNPPNEMTARQAAF